MRRDSAPHRAGPRERADVTHPRTARASTSRRMRRSDDMMVGQPNPRRCPPTGRPGVWLRFRRVPTTTPPSAPNDLAAPHRSVRVECWRGAGVSAGPLVRRSRRRFFAGHFPATILPGSSSSKRSPRPGPRALASRTAPQARVVPGIENARFRGVYVRRRLILATRLTRRRGPLGAAGHRHGATRSPADGPNFALVEREAADDRVRAGAPPARLAAGAYVPDRIVTNATSRRWSNQR